MTISVIVVDDQTLVRSGFESILNSADDITVIGQASNGAEAIDVCRTLAPDVVVMDIRMPVMDGVEATRRLTTVSGGRAPGVLMLTTFDLDELVHAALRAGASGFLLKDAPPDELFRAVRAVAAGDALIAPSITRRLLQHFAESGPSPANTAALAAIDQLTDREREVLTLIARGLSNQEIADEMYVAETTVKTHVGRVFMKLGARDRIQAAIVAYDAGLVIPGTS
jgi:DNA-binding NarL/FixJ family response regulator